MSIECVGEQELGFEFCQSGENPPSSIDGTIVCSVCINGLIRLSKEDPLTEVENRRGAQIEFNRLVKKDNLLGVIHADLVAFGTVNQERDHDFGDEILKIAATYMCSEDYVARMGGDEFIALIVKDRPDNLDESIERRAIDELDPIKRLEAICTRMDAKFLNDPLVREYNDQMPQDSHLRLRFGISLYDEGESLRELVKSADSKGFIVDTKD